jgi:hypothetical protein
MAVHDPKALLTLQFLAWLAEQPRPYSEVMEAWRSSCPRLTVWEDALADGLIRQAGGRSGIVELTQRGHALIEPERIQQPGQVVGAP